MTVINTGNYMQNYFENDYPTNPLRDVITNAYRMDETVCLDKIIPEATLPPEQCQRIEVLAKELVLHTRESMEKNGKIDVLLNKYDLSTEEGIALMCLAEALLRIPDKQTLDQFISDKISKADWYDHLSKDNSFFVNAATWSLVLSGKIYSPYINQEKNLLNSIKKAGSRLGASVIRPIILKMMKAIGNQFVMGETIQSALHRAIAYQAKGYTFSYDMLGESARTQEDAAIYEQAYIDAITAIGKTATEIDLNKNPGISVKLSALYPRYEYNQYKNVMRILPQKLLTLAQLAKQFNIGLNVDAEEADRLDLHLDIFAEVLADASLTGWNGLGLAIQAYQKRTYYVLDWLIDLAQRHHKKINVRLVKGAYWDAEIKTTQVFGYSDYPVFTRKNSTDVAYLACARKMLANRNSIYSQFATHNAYSIAAILELTKHNPKDDFEFQCLHGMGEAIYNQIVDRNRYAQPCRIYAPVGTHKDLLGYLVRRLLENGANSSFINQLANEKIPLEKFVYDPVARIAHMTHKPHPGIPKPKDIYHSWENSQGIDLSNRNMQSALQAQLAKADQTSIQAASIINGRITTAPNTVKRIPITSPQDHTTMVGSALFADEQAIQLAIKHAVSAQTKWQQIDVYARASILEHAAQLFQQQMPDFIALLMREGGKCLSDCISEVRETIDYCRYYAYQAKGHLVPKHLPGPVGELNQLTFHPRGTIVCISPWNFPLAIFCGQLLAALVTGNTVIAKPAEQTPLIAFKAIQLLHQAGIPKDALQLLLGRGEEVGAKLIADLGINGVMFTGSTETARLINLTLANREGPIIPFIAETGGQNAMIVDSTALAEQTIIDIVQSAFNSAGQRCSALRVLFVQEEIAPKLLTMLKGYMAEMVIGDPSKLSTDIGPVIDEDALAMLNNHVAYMNAHGSLLAEVRMPPELNGFYFAPRAYEIPNLDLLTREIFGPILHIIRYAANDLPKVMQSIINTGYGLTLGIQSRLDSTVEYIVKQMPVGNIYINRNMIGAVVGVQPFGGERLSGTGPKAGGPHYLERLCVERSLSNNTTAVGGNARLVSLLEEKDQP